jgi:long-chain acyl-CoA synthetase
VPRFYEKLHSGICERIAASPRPVSALANRALAIGARRAEAARERQKPSALKRSAARVADRVVLRRLRRTLGSNLRYLVSGSAPMPTWLLEWFDGIGLPVLEAYGVSETIMPVAMNRPGQSRLGTVGKPLPGQEVRLAEDNEILVRGPGVFRGYLTEIGKRTEGPDSSGFWATGDYGEFDADGYLRVVGRKSEVFKLSTGRWIAPTGIEANLRQLPYVEHAMVLGAGHGFIVAILALDSARLSVGPKQGSRAANLRKAAAGDPVEIVRRDVFAVTAALSSFQRPAGILLTTERFTIEGGELTSNLKLRRRFVEKKYAKEIERLFATLDSRTEGSHQRIPGETASLLLVRLA